MPRCCWKACRISLRYALPLLVPQVDADGNEIAGFRLPEVAVPLGAYAGSTRISLLELVRAGSGNMFDKVRQ